MKKIVLSDHASPRCKCPSCGYILDAATNIGGKQSPSYGDISICYNCCGICVYDVGLMLRAATPDEIEGFRKMPNWDMVERLRSAVRERKL